MITLKNYGIMIQTAKCVLVFFLVLFLSILHQLNGQSVATTNTGDVGFISVPDDWYVVAGSTDISDANGAAGTTPSCDLMPEPPPPDGATQWMSGFSNPAGNSEISATMITGLVIGKTYSVPVNIMRFNTRSFIPGTFDLECQDWVGDILPYRIGSENRFFDIQDESVWYSENIVFVADQTEMELRIGGTVTDAIRWHFSLNSPITCQDCGGGGCTIVYDYTGDDQTFTVPDGVTEIEVKLWGAGGSCNRAATGGGPIATTGAGGAGGFVSGTMSVFSGDQYTIVVGRGGLWAGNQEVYYGGGGGSNNGSGGGRAAIRTPGVAGVELVTAGGGGSSGPNNIAHSCVNAGVQGCYGGAGGGDVGGDCMCFGSTVAGTGGNTTTMTGGSGHSPNGQNGSQFNGGIGPFETGGNSGGGGGGGYYGGGSGRSSFTFSPCTSNETGGGGGSSYTGGLSAVYQNLQGNGAVPQMTMDPDYSGDIGTGGVGPGGDNGGHARVVVIYNIPEICDNGVDDDCDGDIDCDDSDCQTAPEICDNGIDDNCDGNIDENCCTEGKIVLLKTNVQGCPDHILVDLKVFNEGMSPIPAGTPVAFYDGDPTQAGSSFLGVFNITDVNAGAVKRFNSVDIGTCSTNGELIFAVLGANGSEMLPLDLNTDLPNASYTDCDYSNNISSIKLNIKCGRIITD